MSWLTTQEKKVLLFAFSCLFVGIVASWYFKSHPKSMTVPLNLKERTLMSKEPIDINIADFNQLNSISGIGPTLAEAILDYRKNNGPFQEINDLLKVKGIGKKKLEKIETHILIK